jgi:hypothetical protein
MFFTALVNYWLFLMKRGFPVSSTLEQGARFTRDLLADDPGFPTIRWNLLRFRYFPYGWIRNAFTPVHIETCEPHILELYSPRSQQDNQFTTLRGCFLLGLGCARLSITSKTTATLRLMNQIPSPSTSGRSWYETTATLSERKHTRKEILWKWKSLENLVPGCQECQL